MFACLYSLSTPVTALVTLAEDFTPRFEVVGSLVMLDVSGLSRLFGSPQDIGEHLRRAAGGPVRIALAPTQTAAALLALGRAGLTVMLPGEQPDTLGPMAVSLLADLDRMRLDPAHSRVPMPPPVPRKHAAQPPSVSAMEDALPYFNSCLYRTTESVVTAHCGGGGWMHPRDSHAASQARRTRRTPEATRDTVHAFARADDPRARRRDPAHAPHGAAGADIASAPSTPGTRHVPQGRGHAAPGLCHLDTRATRHVASGTAEIQSLQDTLRRWGIKTFGALAALPAGEVYERLGARGVLWQRLARGEDTTPLVPWVPEDPFEGSLALEWPIEGLEPLSFVLGRLLEPLADRLERADRGAAILHTHLHLVTKEVHARTLQLPAPLRDPRTLRTLMLLDLESNPPAAAVDQVRVLIEPTPARVLQWMLFARAQPSPEQVSTLIARLGALMGETHVGSPALVNSWRPGAFEMKPFIVAAPGTAALTTMAPDPVPSHPAGTAPDRLGGQSSTQSALRRFRLPVPARVQVAEGRPVRLMTDRRGITGGAVLQSAGPWRTSGEWWNDAQPGQHWDRDEWDVAIADGTVYRVFVERHIGQWFIEGVVD